MANFKVLMLGGRRCGKSSILASMDHLLGNDENLTKFVKIWDSGKGEIHDVPLYKKQDDLKNFIVNNRQSDCFLVDFNADSGFSRYIFNVKVPENKGGTMTIEFVDPHGESYSREHPDFDKLREEFKSTDVFIIAIDTPYLMGDEEGYASSVNQVKSIQALFNELECVDNEYDLKKIIFAPVKCERWKNDIDSVRHKFEEIYKPVINALPKKKCGILFLPVYTAGSIEFNHFSNPQILKSDVSIKCERMGSSNFVRLANGRAQSIKDIDEVIINEAFLNGEIPYYSWFTITGDSYKPENCDQIVYHVLRFLLFKFYIIKEHRPFFVNWWKFLFNDEITLSNLRKIIDGLKSNQLIKDGGDGIINMRQLDNEIKL